MQNNSKHSSVIVLYEQSTKSIILTKRSEHLRSHPGEICFPGGICEKKDKSFLATALRELYEEMGISTDRVTLIKELKIEKTLLGVIIHPWLAKIESIHPYHLNLQEVVSLISIPISLVQDITNYRDLIFEKGGRRLLSYEFIVNEDRVWGATARIMKQLAHEAFTIL